MIRVILADGSAVIRSVEKQIFSDDKEFSVVAVCSNAQEIQQSLAREKPDVLVYDEELAGMRDVLRSLQPTQTVTVLLSVNNCDLFCSADVKFLKPDFMSMTLGAQNKFVHEVKEKILRAKNLKNAKSSTSSCGSGKLCSIRTNVPDLGGAKFSAVLVGVSTGGPKTLKMLLDSLGGSIGVPVFITQHIDSTFDKNMVSWLDKTEEISVSLAADGEVPRAGTAYFAPSDSHLTFVRDACGTVRIHLDKGAPVNFLRPAVDKMFESGAQVFAKECLAVLLTGMGSDGAEGCGAIKKAGGYTIGESAETCVVYGMPKAAYDAGFIDEQLPLYKIGCRVKELLERKA